MSLLRAGHQSCFGQRFSALLRKLAGPPASALQIQYLRVIKETVDSHMHPVPMSDSARTFARGVRPEAISSLESPICRSRQCLTVGRQCVRASFTRCAPPPEVLVL